MPLNIIKSTEGLNRTERQTKGEFAPCLCWDIHLLLTSDISAPGSQAFGLGQGLTPLPACKWQIMRLLSPHNHKPIPTSPHL